MRLDRPLLPAIALATALGLSACTTPPPERVARREMVVAVTASNHLIRFNAGAPAKLLSSKVLTGLQPGEQVLGIDYRIAKGWLYAVGSTNRLYRINTITAIATPVGERFAVPLTGNHFGVDFNPTVDRLRIVSDTGQSLRVNPDTAAVVDGDAVVAGIQVDGPLAYATGDPAAEQRASIVAVAYTYNKTDEKLTTNFALDASAGALVTMGSREGKTPAVSPNSGHLFTVGGLGAGPFDDAAFDIADVSGAAFAALTSTDARESRWVELDLATGAARSIGTIGGGEAVIGIAIEP